jgi:5-(carboxyamino)imidazole ribonucleotide synthase
VVRSAVDAADWFANISEFGGSLLAEQKVNFVGEVAQLSARTPSGDFKAWPLVETIQENGVCATVIAPRPNTSDAMFEQALEIAKTVADGLGVTGVLAVEMFVTADDELLINELAMRPHNSGHFSIEGSATSQFEQHLRAVLDLPLGDTTPRGEWSVMINLLGVDDKNTFVENFEKAMKLHPRAKLHTYGKGARQGRKMGHVTVVADDLEYALKEAKAAAAVLLQG